jgi:hypothetical protein
MPYFIGRHVAVMNVNPPISRSQCVLMNVLLLEYRVCNNQALEAPDGRLATSHGIGLNLKMNVLGCSYFAMAGNNSKLRKKNEFENILNGKLHS